MRNRNMNKFTNTPTEIDNYVEILKKQLYFAVLKGKTCMKLKNNLNTFFFSTDDELIYENYYSDFGPLNISCVFKYCTKLRKYLQYAKGLKSVVYYTSDHPEKKANAACLIGLFSIIYLNFHPKDIWKLLNELGPFKQFLDASQCPGGFTLKISDCILAVHKALAFNFFNFDDFNVTEYDLYDKLQYGDMNWLIPRKFLAFIGPADNKTAHPPDFYIKYFLKNDVKTVIRLNSIIYDANVFIQVGIQHFDLIFPDGTTPPKDILLKFLTIAEMAPAAIAVHCKAGLGRTGSLIGAYLVKHYCMTAREAIAWMRLCRPGSVIGQQQVWLEKLENWLWKIGSQYRIRKYGADDKIPRHKYGIYSREWPIEREKIIAEARKKIQKSFTKSQLVQISKQKKYSASMDSFSKNIKLEKSLKKLAPDENIPYKSVSKFIASYHGSNKNPTPSNMSNINNYQPRISNYPKSEYEDETVTNYRRNQNSFEKRSTKNSTTQGDKLNDIKASWLNNRTSNKTFVRNEQYQAEEQSRVSTTRKETKDSIGLRRANEGKGDRKLSFC